MQLVCQTYLEAPELYFQADTHTVSVDEMPGIQAIERIAKKIPMQPGKPERIEYEYRRHGTLCLIGNWDVVTGQMIAPTIGATRTEEDLVQHIHATIQTDPTAKWVFVMDNLNVHCSESLVRYVAKLEGMDESTLGIKGTSGILLSMATRQAFLMERAHRIRFVYTPKHSSWLNQIEIVFGIVHRRAIVRGSFASLEALKQRLLSFIDYFNRTFAQPFRWTYTGHLRQSGGRVADRLETRGGGTVHPLRLVRQILEGVHQPSRVQLNGHQPLGKTAHLKLDIIHDVTNTCRQGGLRRCVVVQPLGKFRSIIAAPVNCCITVS